MIADLAPQVTLVPGDGILMGTPCRSRWVHPGQIVEREVTRLGRIAGTVTARDAPHASASGVVDTPTDSPQVRCVAQGATERVRGWTKGDLRHAKEGAV